MERRSSPPRSRWRPRTTTVEIIPLFHGDERLGVMVAFIDVTRPHATSNQLEQARRELETAYEEIQSTVEELETTNEELETTNEELQSTNQELSTVNTELEERTGQLNQSNSFFESVLESMRAAVIVLAEDLSIETWNSLAEETFGLSAAEVEGKNLFSLDFGLPVDELRQAIRDCMSGAAAFVEATLDATNRRGRPIRSKVVCSQMKDETGDAHGVILLIEEIRE